MENASKALLIAGAILIVILLIGVGMMIYSGAQGTIGQATSQMSAQEIQAFNSQFEQYEGTNVNATNVKALISAVETNNQTNDTQVELTGITTRNSVTTTSRYTVTLTKTNGYVTSINISANS